MSTRTSSPDDDRAPAIPNLTRRNVVVGAAWSVPVTLLMAQVPAHAAASQMYLVQFDKSSYTVLGCSTISGATVTVKNKSSSQAVAGVAVSLTLPSGLTFASGATTFSGTTNGSGVVALPAINTPSTGGTYTLTAVVSSDSGSSSAVVNPKSTARSTSTATVTATFTSVVGAALAVGPDYFLTKSGDLYSGNTKIATGVLTAIGFRIANGNRYVDYVTSSGGFRILEANPAPNATMPNVPTNAVPVGSSYFLTPGGDLYSGNTKAASNIASARGWNAYGNGNSDQGWCDVVDKNGLATRYADANIQYTYNSVPATAPTPGFAVGPDYFLTRSGDLYSRNTKIATGVLTAIGFRIANGNRYVDYVTNSGGFRILNATTAPNATMPSVPTNAVPVGSSYFLTPGGDLYSGNTKAASNIASARGWNAYGNGNSDQGWCDVVDKNGLATRYADANIQYTYNSVPAGAKALGAGYYLTPAGDLYFGNTKTASNIASAAGWTTYNNNSLATAISTTGTYYQFSSANLTSTGTGSYPGATAIGGNYFLTTNGDFYIADTKIASGVISAYGYAYADVSYGDTVGTDGVARAYNTASLTATFSGVQMGTTPAPSKALGAGYYLTPAGDLYFGNTKTASNIASTAGWTTYNNNSLATAISTTGTYYQFSSANLTSTGTGSYPGATAIGGNYFLTTNGDFYIADTKIASGVISAYGYAYADVSYGDTVGTDGVARAYNTASLTATFSGVQMGTTPAPSKALGAGYYLTPAGDLYFGNTKTASNIASAAGWTTYNNNSLATAISTTGTYYQFSSANLTSTGTGSYPGATAIGGNYFLTTNGDFYIGDTKISSNVTSAYGYAYNDTSYGDFLTVGSC